jgi:hypothetical protein
MDRAFIEELALPSQTGGPWDWEQRASNGKPFTELQLIGFHTRATRRLDESQTRWLLEKIERLPIRAELC